MYNCKGEYNYMRSNLGITLGNANASKESCQYIERRPFNRQHLLINAYPVLTRHRHKQQDFAKARRR